MAEMHGREAAKGADHCLHACRLWGKIFVSALEVKGSFDAASLTAFLWAATTAGVGHFKTVSLGHGSADVGN